MSLDVGCELWVNAKRIPDGGSGNTDAPVTLTGLTVTWGRETYVDQPEPATLSARILDRGAGTVRAQDMVKLGWTALVWAGTPGGERRVVFGGRVTDVDVAWDDAGGGAVLTLIAVDLMGDLANRFVGAEPWVMETLAQRASRIVAAVAPGTPLTVDGRPGALQVSRMDVDRQAADGLLNDLATSGTAAIWVLTDTAGKAKIRIEDTSAREGLWVLVKGADGLWRPGPSANAGRQLDAAAVVRDAVKWVRATSDLVTRVTVRWLDQSTSPDTTERSVGLVDTVPEKTYGARGLSVGTVLANATDATNIANTLMAALSESAAWRASGVRWDLDAAEPTDDGRLLALDLLDNLTRFGLAITIAPLPAWVPAGAEAGMYIDGGVYSFEGGRWVMDLATTSAAPGGESLT